MRRRAEASASYPAKGKSVIRYSRNISIVSCPTAILFLVFSSPIQIFEPKRQEAIPYAVLCLMKKTRENI
ncbi:hypothetical protein EYS33_21685 [Salmonella enterica subsp. enterica serovar Hadar]|nr:hypothetical protein EYS33_21685 [Salmonella enterica subsp. enterica serovar Hadar]